MFSENGGYETRLEQYFQVDFIFCLRYLPILPTHGNPPLAISGPQNAIGEEKLAYVEVFPPVATGGPPMDHRWKIRKFWNFLATECCYTKYSRT